MQEGAKSNLFQKCGGRISISEPDSKVEDDVTGKTLSLERYTKLKGTERASHFCKKRSGPEAATASTTTSTKTPKPNQKYVTIQVGIMRRDDVGNLKCVRGSKLPVKVGSSVDAHALKMASVDKHSLFDQTFCGLEDYVLLYPDGKEVIYVPGNTPDPKTFQLCTYKQELGKPYSQIYLYLCQPVDFNWMSDFVSEEQSTINDYFHDGDIESGGLDSIFDDIADIDPFAPIKQNSSTSSALANHTVQTECCPICHKNFSKEAIESHVDECLDTDSWRTLPPMHKNCAPPTNLSLEEELCAAQKTFVDNEKNIKFVLRLRYAFKDSMKKMRMHFKLEKDLVPISVEFVGESAIDDGGPRRELFTTVFDEAKDFVLTGPEKQYTLQHDVHKNENKDFYYFGKFIALSLLHGGPGPHNFSRPLTQFILGLEPELQVDQVPDYDVQEQLKQIINCTTQEDLDAILSSFDARFEAGYNKPVIKLSDVKDLADKVCKYFVITRQLEEIQQFCDGLSSNGILEILKKYPERSTEEFVYNSNAITAELIKNMFQVKFCSDKESPLRASEEDVIFQWINFLEEVESGSVPAVEIHEMDGSVKNMKVTLEHVLKFLCGCKFVPVGGLGKKGDINFVHNCGERRLSVSTCWLSITFPVNERYSSDSFSQNMVEDIIESPGFGNV